MATKPPITSAFIAKLLAPIPADELAIIEREVRKELAESWHANWIAARRDVHLLEAADLDRLHNVFHGDKTQRDISEARFRAYEAVERMILTPGTSQDDVKAKRVMARKVVCDPKNWPIEWVAAMEDDERYIASRKRRAA